MIWAAVAAQIIAAAEVQAQSGTPTTVIITGQKPAPPSADCASTPSGGLGGSGPNYACLNQKLAQASRNTASTPSATPGDLEPDRLGQVTVAGTREQLGSAFGTSAIPQRPTAPPVYTPPLSAPPAAATAH